MDKEGTFGPKTGENFAELPVSLLRCCRVL